LLGGESYGEVKFEGVKWWWDCDSSRFQICGAAFHTPKH